MFRNSCHRYCGEGRDIGCFEVPDIICYYSRLCLETHVTGIVEKAEILVALRFLISSVIMVDYVWKLMPQVLWRVLI